MTRATPSRRSSRVAGGPASAEPTAAKVGYSASRWPPEHQLTTDIDPIRGSILRPGAVCQSSSTATSFHGATGEIRMGPDTFEPRALRPLGALRAKAQNFFTRFPARRVQGCVTHRLVQHATFERRARRE